MEPTSVSYVAVLVATVAAMAVGFLWYSLPVLGTAWMKAVGLKEEDIKKGPGLGYAGAVVANIVTAYVLGHFINYVDASTVTAGAVTGFWAWLGFVAATMAMNYIFEGRSVKLYAINAGMQLVALIVMGMILAAWR